MKKILFMLCVSCAFVAAHAQISALTQTGDEVVLYNDGTWEYVSDVEEVVLEIPLNEKQFFKDEASGFLVKSKKFNIGVWLNPKQWRFSKAMDNEAAEYQFEHKEGDLYGMMISEKMEIPLETLRGIAIENARIAAPDVKVLKEEYRVVNGIKVLMLQMTGTIQGMKFTYFGYYYTNTEGTVQLIMYTGSSIFQEYESTLEIFLNGITEV